MPNDERSWKAELLPSLGVKQVAATKQILFIREFR